MQYVRKKVCAEDDVQLSGIPMQNDLFPILVYPIILGGRRGTLDEFATISFHLVLFSAALVELAKSIPVHSLILSSHLFFCLPLFLFPFTVICRSVFAKPEDLETWPNHLSFRFLTRVSDKGVCGCLTEARVSLCLASPVFPVN